MPPGPGGSAIGTGIAGFRFRIPTGTAAPPATGTAINTGTHRIITTTLTHIPAPLLIFSASLIPLLYFTSSLDLALRLSLLLFALLTLTTAMLLGFGAVNLRLIYGPAAGVVGGMGGGGGMDGRLDEALLVIHALAAGLGDELGRVEARVANVEGEVSGHVAQFQSLSLDFQDLSHRLLLQDTAMQNLQTQLQTFENRLQVEDSRIGSLEVDQARSKKNANRDGGRGDRPKERERTENESVKSTRLSHPIHPARSEVSRAPSVSVWSGGGGVGGWDAQSSSSRNFNGNGNDGWNNNNGGRWDNGNSGWDNNGGGNSGWSNAGSNRNDGVWDTPSTVKASDSGNGKEREAKYRGWSTATSLADVSPATPRARSPSRPSSRSKSRQKYQSPTVVSIPESNSRDQIQGQEQGRSRSKSQRKSEAQDTITIIKKDVSSGRERRMEVPLPAGMEPKMVISVVTRDKDGNRPSTSSGHRKEVGNAGKTDKERDRDRQKEKERDNHQKRKCVHAEPAPASGNTNNNMRGGRSAPPPATSAVPPPPPPSSRHAGSNYGWDTRAKQPSAIRGTGNLATSEAAADKVMASGGGWDSSQRGGTGNSDHGHGGWDSSQRGGGDGWGASQTGGGWGNSQRGSSTAGWVASQQQNQQQATNSGRDASQRGGAGGSNAGWNTTATGAGGNGSTPGWNVNNGGSQAGWNNSDNPNVGGGGWSAGNTGGSTSGWVVTSSPVPNSGGGW